MVTNVKPTDEKVQVKRYKIQYSIDELDFGLFKLSNRPDPAGKTG